MVAEPVTVIVFDILLARGSNWSRLLIGVTPRRLLHGTAQELRGTLVSSWCKDPVAHQCIWLSQFSARYRDVRLRRQSRPTMRLAGQCDHVHVGAAVSTATIAMPACRQPRPSSPASARSRTDRYASSDPVYPSFRRRHPCRRLWSAEAAAVSKHLICTVPPPCVDDAIIACDGHE